MSQLKSRISYQCSVIPQQPFNFPKVCIMHIAREENHPYISASPQGMLCSELQFHSMAVVFASTSIPKPDTGISPVRHAQYFHQRKTDTDTAPRWNIGRQRTGVVRHVRCQYIHIAAGVNWHRRPKGQCILGFSSETQPAVLPLHRQRKQCRLQQHQYRRCESEQEQGY